MKIRPIEYLCDTSLRVPDATALVDATGHDTFAQLTRKAHAVAKALRALLPGHNQPVALFLPKGRPAIAALAGISMAGHIYVPLDTQSPPERSRLILASLGASAVVTTAVLASRLADLGIGGIPCVVLEDVLAQVDEDRPLAGLWDEAWQWTPSLIDADPCYVIFTSGSTGVPKGVTIAHRSVIDYVEWLVRTYDVTIDERIANQAPLFFDNSVLDIYLCFATGASLYLVPESHFGFPARLLDWLAEHEITTIFWVPSVLVTVANSGLLATRPPKSLRKILFAGEVMPVKPLNEWMAALPGRLFSNLYGPTEITVDCTYFIVPGPVTEPSLPIGFPCRNTDILILDEQDRPAPANTVGELCVRGSSLALGYWNSSEKTEPAFVQNPLHSRYPERIYRTGDLVRADEKGCIYFVGRRDSQVKLRGYRIELGEIEAVLTGHPQVETACVLFDRDRQTIHAVYTGQPELDTRELSRFVAQRLPKYMVPAQWHPMSALPLNSNGKIDRLELQRRLREAR